MPLTLQKRSIQACIVKEILNPCRTTDFPWFYGKVSLKINQSFHVLMNKFDNLPWFWIVLLINISPCWLLLYEFSLIARCKCVARFGTCLCLSGWNRRGWTQITELCGEGTLQCSNTILSPFGWLSMTWCWWWSGQVHWGNTMQWLKVSAQFHH